MAVNQLPILPLTPEQQKRLSIELYGLLAEQVKRYHAHYHMGQNSSVPTEVAQELLASIHFTLGTAGGYRPGTPIDDQLKQGQAILEEESRKARQLLRLVRATAPEHQSQCRWEAMEGLGRYLDRYDHLHFAHRPPEEPDYPLLTPLPEELTGIYRVEAYLQCLWAENQILDALPDPEELFRLAPPGYWDAPQNLCEQPLWNAMGKALLSCPPDPLAMTDGEREALPKVLSPERLEAALDHISREFHFTPALRSYAQGALDNLLPRLTPTGLGYLFW